MTNKPTTETRKLPADGVGAAMARLDAIEATQKIHQAKIQELLVQHDDLDTKILESTHAAGEGDGLLRKKIQELEERFNKLVMNVDQHISGVEGK